MRPVKMAFAATVPATRLTVVPEGSAGGQTRLRRRVVDAI